MSNGVKAVDEVDDQVGSCGQPHFGPKCSMLLVGGECGKYGILYLVAYEYVGCGAGINRKFDNCAILPLQKVFWQT